MCPSCLSTRNLINSDLAVSCGKGEENSKGCFGLHPPPQRGGKSCWLTGPVLFLSECSSTPSEFLRSASSCNSCIEVSNGLSHTSACWFVPLPLSERSRVTLILVLQNVHLRSNLVVPRSRDFQVWCVSPGNLWLQHRLLNFAAKLLPFSSLRDQQAFRFWSCTL